MVNYDTPRQYLNFSWRDFWYSSSSGVMWPSSKSSTFGKRILPLMRIQLVVPYRAYLLLILCSFVHKN